MKSDSANIQRSDSTRISGGGFPATRWSMILRVKSPEGAEANAALAEICRVYWQPVYSFLRRQGNNQQDAEDLTQGFFALLLRRDSLATVDEAKGKLRTFLLVALKRFAANEHERAMAAKRGGRVQHVSIDAEAAEQRYASEPSTKLTPDVLFEKQWALTLLDTVLHRLKEEYARDGRERIFDGLKSRLSVGDDSDSLAVVAAELGMNEGAVKVAVFRLRQRYRKQLHDQIALTVESPDDVNEEIMHLFKLFETRD